MRHRTPSIRSGVVPAALAAAALAAPAAAHAADAPADTLRPWATINVCDTATRPNTIGMRASVAGGGNASEQLFVRFQVQLYGVKDALWQPLAAGGDSGYLDAGSAKQKVREIGRSFVVAPVAGRAYQLRGVVTFQWRSKSGAVLRSVRRKTTAGHVSSAGADPPGFSAATCTVV